MAALAPTTLRINDGHQGKAEAPVVKGKSFQLTTDEAHVAPDVVTGLCFNPIFYCFIYLCLHYNDLVCGPFWSMVCFLMFYLIWGLSNALYLLRSTRSFKMPRDFGFPSRGGGCG